MRLKSVGFGPEEFLSEIEKFFGGSGETRTRDQRIKSPLLYRLSYRPTLQNKVLYSAKPKIVVEFS